MIGRRRNAAELHRSIRHFDALAPPPAQGSAFTRRRLKGIVAAGISGPPPGT
jgi:hypothetical protein